MFPSGSSIRSELSQSSRKLLRCEVKEMQKSGHRGAAVLCAAAKVDVTEPGPNSVAPPLTATNVVKVIFWHACNSITRVDSKSQYVYPLSGKRPKSLPHISITSLVETKSSSDLDSGRRPELKSEDFSFLPKGLARYSRILVEIARSIASGLRVFEKGGL